MTTLFKDSFDGVATIAQLVGTIKDDPTGKWRVGSANAGTPASWYTLTAGKLVSSGYNHAYLYRALPGLTTFVKGVKFTPAAADGNNRPIMAFEGAGGGNQGIHLRATSGDLQVATIGGGPTVVDRGATTGLGLVGGTEYAIEMKAVFVSGTSWTVTARVNGIVKLTVTNASFGLTSIAQYQLGCPSVAVLALGNGDKWDNAYIDDADFAPGGGLWQILSTRPSGPGAHTDWVPDSGANWARVNEQNVDDASYVQGTLDGDIDTYEYDDISLPSGFAIRSIQHNSRAAYLAVSKKLAHVSRLSGVEAQGADQTLSASLGWVGTVMSLDPNGNAWSGANFNATQHGRKQRP